MRLHRYAIAVALCTVGLLFAGNLVSTTESGLACPDWPLCEGQFIPKMIDGKQFEHTHRLVASFVGAMTFGLCALIWKYRRRDRLLTRLGTLAAVGVTVQALLGALTVKLKLPWWVSSTHFAVATAFFTLVVSLAWLTRQRLPLPPEGERARVGGEIKFIAPVVVLTWLQMVAGGVMRHLRGGLACGFEFPTCLGELWPIHEHWGVQAHMVHRVLGLAVGVAVIALFVYLVRHPLATRAVRVLAGFAAVLTFAQVLLGIMTVLLSREFTTMTVHSTVGALLLGTVTSLYWLANPVKPAQVETQSVAPELAPAPMKEAA